MNRQRLLIAAKRGVVLCSSYVLFVLLFLDDILNYVYDTSVLTFESGKDYLVVSEMHKTSQSFMIVAFVLLVVNVVLSGIFLLNHKKTLGLWVMIPSIVCLLYMGFGMFITWILFDGYMM